MPGQQGAVPFGQQGAVPLAQQGAVWAVAVAIEVARARPSAQVAMSFCMGSILLLVALPTNQSAARDKKPSVFARLSKQKSYLHSAAPRFQEAREATQRRLRQSHRRAGSFHQRLSTFVAGGKAQREPQTARRHSLCGNTRGPSPSCSAKAPCGKPATAQGNSTPPTPRAARRQPAKPPASGTRAVART